MEFRSGTTPDVSEQSPRVLGAGHRVAVAGPDTDPTETDPTPVRATTRAHEYASLARIPSPAFDSLARAPGSPRGVGDL